MKKNITNTNIDSICNLPTPSEIISKLPHSNQTLSLIKDSRESIQNIMDGTDPRPLIIVGPCSIHDPKAAIDYAKRLAELQKKLEKKYFIIMRVYFEKPRTTIGWKGLINDPDMNQSYNIKKGLEKAREILLEILELGLPTASEMLDTIVPQYIADLVSWASLGARTTESQPHREMASGLSMPIGFKNATNGDISIAINAMEAAKHPHSFIGTNTSGIISQFKTSGNPYGHLILRGGTNGPNYDLKTIKKYSEILKTQQLQNRILIDCSHGNSRKNHKNQPGICEEVLKNAKDNPEILGVMLESNLFEGNQKMQSIPANLEYGKSITDACISWETTEELLANI